MMVHYTARQTTLTPEVKQYCEKRLKAMDKLMRRVLEVDLIFTTARNKRHWVEIHVKAKGAGLVVQDEDEELMKAAALAFDNLEKKLKRDKDKFRERKRRQGREAAAPEAVPAEVEAEPEAGRRIIAGNDVSVKPMTVDEAALILDEAKKDVLVFRKLGSEKWAVLYRRRDGHYGLVEPEG
jgi:putative sigma-54 modulation protein